MINHDIIPAGKRVASRRPAWAFCVLFPFFLGSFVSIVEGQTTDPNTVPLWKQGVSTWNGTGYSLPSSTPEPLPVAPVDDAPPYTVPVAPGQAASSWQTPGLEFNPYVPDQSLSSTEIPVTDKDWNTPNAGLPSPAQAVDSAPSDNALQQVSATEELPLPINDPRGVEPAIGSAIEANAAVEQPPLEEEVVRWYHYPQRWISGWDSHAEFGLDGSDGNADTLAIQTGLETKRKTDEYTLAIDAEYRQASSRGTTTEGNGRLNIDYDRLLADSAWSGFGKFGLEWDRFKPFDLRLNVNGGLGYYWVRDDTTTLVSRFGAGASREIGAVDDDWVAEAVFGFEAERQLTARQKIKGKIDYFPAWEDFSDYRLVSDMSWEILLDGSENLSLKLAATDRYDSTPQGARPNDVYYSMLLLYKF